MARKLKFGSPAWRKKYLGHGKKKNRKRNKAKGPNTFTRAGRKAKRKRLKEMIAKKNRVRKNPPAKWIKCNAVRVIKKNGRRVLQVKK